MTTQKTTEQQELTEAIARMLDDEYVVETNEGTFGAAECCRKTGCGDPQFGHYTIYERLDGHRRVVGCEPKKAPGYPRRFRDEINAARKQLAELRRELRSTR